MAGIYIQMKTPKGCAFCKIKRRNGNKMVCPLCDEEWDIHDPTAADHRLEHCPLIPVPDHGRLGDLDALDGLLEGLSEDDYNRTHAPKNWERALSVMRDYLDVVPTIIPADKEVDYGEKV